MSLVPWLTCGAAIISSIPFSTAFTGSEYVLTHEYSGQNFFDGWDFYSGRDPTNGFVTYYSRSSAELKALIHAAEGTPAYMGVNYIDKLPFDSDTDRGDGAGRPSVRIESKQAFTHGLFVGDFQHIPAGICGTWPAFWTLGPKWPNTGEIDILEGVNLNTNNLMSLHTNETCMIEADASVMSGTLASTNCAYSPSSNVGCGVEDARSTSFGSAFNSAGGGAVAMQWTSESIKIWYWPKQMIPADVNSKKPDPSSWGQPAALLGVGNCDIDEHFQSHKIIFDTTFCGDYAGKEYVWKSDDEKSCADYTGASTCENFVANNPEAFKDAYWNVNYVRVYQLLDPPALKERPYIASEQPPRTATNTAPPIAATPNLDADPLCPKYNYRLVSDGKYTYEVACDVDPPGPDIVEQPYEGFTARSLADCIRGCTYINEKSGVPRCGAVAHAADSNFCFFKKYVDGTPVARTGYNELRLIYYGYPEITDDPSKPAESTETSMFVDARPTPQTYRPQSTTNTTTPYGNTTTSTSTSSMMMTTTMSADITLPPPMGDNTTTTSSDSVPADYSETVTSGYGNVTTSGTRTTSTISTVIASTDPQATASDFYIVFNVPRQVPSRLAKRDIEYLSFDSEKLSVLVTSEADAAKFFIDTNGNLKTANLFVATDMASQPPRLLLQESPSSPPIKLLVNPDGTVSIDGISSYCVRPDNVLAIVPDGMSPPSDCQLVQPALLAVSDSVSTTTTTSSMSRTGFGTATTTPNPNPTVTVISTTYVALCPICPNGLTTQATTITVPHCGCTESFDHAAQTAIPIPSPTIPMTTITTSCACGEASTAQSAITLTLPDESSIAELATQLAQTPISSTVAVQDSDNDNARPGPDTSAESEVAGEPLPAVVSDSSPATNTRPPQDQDQAAPSTPETATDAAMDTDIETDANANNLNALIATLPSTNNDTHPTYKPDSPIAPFTSSAPPSRLVRFRTGMSSIWRERSFVLTLVVGAMVAGCVVAI